MATLPSGITYESLEDRFLADAHSLLAKQSSGTNGNNPSNINMITALTYNAQTGNYTLTATIPCESSIDTANGNVNVNAKAIYT